MQICKLVTIHRNTTTGIKLHHWSKVLRQPSTATAAHVRTGRAPEPC